MPNPANPQSWNRYSYVNNSPIIFADPTGHCIKMMTNYGESCFDEKTSKFSLGGGDLFQNKKETAVASAFMAEDEDALNDALDAFESFDEKITIVIASTLYGDGSMTAVDRNYSAATAVGTDIFTRLVDNFVSGGLGCPNCSNVPLPFGNLSKEWHIGLEYGNQMNVIHLGNARGRGIHLAFGSTAPKVADLHIYVYPKVYVWRPGWQGEFDIWPNSFGWRK